MILRQQLFRISDAVSVEGEFFAIAHDDFTESQFLQVSAVENYFYGRSEESGMIFYLGEQVNGGITDSYFAAILEGDDNVTSVFFRVEDIRFSNVDGIFIFAEFYEGNRF